MVAASQFCAPENRVILQSARAIGATPLIRMFWRPLKNFTPAAYLGVIPSNTFAWIISLNAEDEPVRLVVMRVEVVLL